MKVWVVWTEDNGDHLGGKFYGVYSDRSTAQIRAWAEWGANVEEVQIDAPQENPVPRAVSYLTGRMEWLKHHFPAEHATAEAFLAQHGKTL